ncbi:ABC transporter permease [Metabacillus niabensis]|uniref:ABC-2 type transport system permease protein n=1 Tax=Metabacillus niabensis TaxID=324854 RepID=A0ABT9YX49_9BACI|nr:ABC transporter permease [Metabacillus niabensis]MDQ0224564.1 ABC-2 type transport system permease protein [Metabacillus niabensis]
MKMTYLHLLRNEYMKQFKRPRIWMFIGFMIVMNIIAGLFFKLLFRQTDFMFWDYIHASSYLLLVIQFICIIIAGDIVSSEYERGTVKLLFTRPIKKLHILSSKYIMTLYCILFFVLMQFAMSGLIGLIFFSDTLLALSEQVLISLGSYLFTFIEMIVICTVAFCLSAITRSSVISIAVSIFLVFTSSIVITLLQHYKYEAGKYLLFANSNLMPYFFGDPLFEGMTLVSSIVNILVHFIFLFFLSYIFIAKRDVHV